MQAAKMETLHSFLNEEGRELLNIKFIPGTGRGLNKDQFEQAARESIKRVRDAGLVDRPPLSTDVSPSHAA